MQFAFHVSSITAGGVRYPVEELPANNPPPTSGLYRITVTCAEGQFIHLGTSAKSGASQWAFRRRARRGYEVKTSQPPSRFTKRRRKVKKAGAA